jgi:DNA-binding winged helix-turn-helix (wHTH) protein/tetratricopeptide (TPR) repeat protein
LPDVGARANLRYIAAGVAMHVAGSVFRSKSFGCFEVDLKAAELRKRGIRIKLQDQPFQILTFLMEHPGDLVTREEIRQRLWAEHTFVDFDRSLNKAMTKLRSALGDSADSPRYIETIPRHGYRFLAEVRSTYDDHGIETSSLTRLQESDAPTAAVSSMGPTAAITPLRVREFRILPRSGNSRALSALFIVGLLGIGAFLGLRQFGVRAFRSAPLPRPSVAVLGFKNLSADPQNAWLSTAFSDWLMTELAAGEQLRTIPAEGIVRMKMELSLPEVESLGKDTLGRVGKNLGTDYVVSGSYAPLGATSKGQIRLDLRLQDTRNGETIGAFSESGSESDLSNLIARAGERLRQTLGVPATTKEEAAEVATNVPMKADTARLYSQGLAKLRDFDALAARTLLTEAVQLEPNYAASHAALANALLQLGYDGQAVAEAKKAFDLSSSSLSRAERLLVEARYREVSRDWNRAIEIYRALFDFFPDNLEYGLSLTKGEVAANKWKDALDTIDELRRLPVPLRDDPRIDLAENDAARSLGDTRRAEAALARAAEKAKSKGTSLLLAKARREQAWLFENSGREEQVEGAVTEAMQLYVAAHDQLGVAAVATLQAIALGRQGDYRGAEKKYQESLAIYKASGNKMSLGAEYDNIGDIYLFLGEARRAETSYEASLAAYREIGDQNGVALAEVGLGDVFLLRGQLNEAQNMYREAFDTCKQLGSRNRQALALAGLAKVRQFQGQPAEARRQEIEAVSILQDVGNKTEAARVRLGTAELLLNEGRVADAAAIALESATVLEEKKARRSAALARLLLAQTLLKQGKIREARDVAEQVATAAGRGQDREVQLRSEMVVAQIAGAAGGNSAEIAASIRRLDAVARAAAAASFAGLAFEARLLKAEQQVNHAERDAGRTGLLALERDCNNAGFAAMAQRASALLQDSLRPGA